MCVCIYIYIYLVCLSYHTTQTTCIHIHLHLHLRAPAPVSTCPPCPSPVSRSISCGRKRRAQGRPSTVPPRDSTKANIPHIIQLTPHINIYTYTYTYTLISHSLLVPPYIDRPPTGGGGGNGSSAPPHNCTSPQVRTLRSSGPHYIQIHIHIRAAAFFSNSSLSPRI